MREINDELRELAEYLGARRDAILQVWRVAIAHDPALTSSDSLPRGQLFDHIPDLLATFERQLSQPSSSRPSAVQGIEAAAQAPAMAHGHQRWKQGYNLREVTRELGKLNEAVIVELDAYARAYTSVSPDTISRARSLWAAQYGTAIEESVGQYFTLQQQEAAGHVKDLETALADVREVEQQRADMWRQAAHDLRGNLGVVANATVGLTHSSLGESSRDAFVRILMRNVTSLHHLLDDVTSLARLQAGAELRRIEPLDITPIMQQLCEGIRPLAQQRRLFLRCDGPPGFAADGDAVKIRRIAQNLVLNAVKFTQTGGITVSWGDSEANDTKRWALTVSDTGPGLQAVQTPIVQAIEHGEGGAEAGVPSASSRDSLPRPHDSGGEGLGLSIVKRLCELLDASVEVKSEPHVGTTFRILFPRHYLH